MSIINKTAAIIRRLVIVSDIKLNSDIKYTTANGIIINMPNCWAALISLEREEIKTLIPMLKIQESGARSSSITPMFQLGKYRYVNGPKVNMSIRNINITAPM